MSNKELVLLRRAVWIHQDDGTHFCSECGHDAEWRLVENDGNQIRSKNTVLIIALIAVRLWKWKGRKKREKDL